MQLGGNMDKYLSERGGQVRLKMFNPNFDRTPPDFFI